MAKQTFTTGQVLTAAQMTSLQQTAMLGGEASAKTASYTLVAADAGTAVSMNNAGATSIIVNTGLFAAGDTVHITNLGAGVCTITAGTATVNSSASLALAQYESGFLDFTSTSAAIFVKGAGAAPSSGGMTLISTTTLTGASITLSLIPQTYNSLYLVIENYQPATDGQQLLFRYNGVSTTTYREAGITFTSQQLTKAGNDNLGGASNFCKTDNTTVLGFGFIEIFDYANTTTNKLAVYQSFTNDETNPTTTWRISGASGTSSATTAITSLVFLPASGNFTSGSIRLYGVK